MRRLLRGFDFFSCLSTVYSKGDSILERDLVNYPNPKYYVWGLGHGDTRAKLAYA